MRAQLGHSQLGKRLVHDAAPFPYQIPQHRLLRRGKRGSTNPFGLDRPAILAGPEHQIRHAIAENGLAALLVIERIDQCEALVVLASQRTNRLSFERVCRRLRRRQTRRHGRLASGEGQVDRQMMSAELQHPRRRR